MSASTPRPDDEPTLWAHVTEARWLKYQQWGTSASMMDHYYDKIAQFDPAVAANSYIQDEATKRVKPLVEICLHFGRTGKVPI